MAHVSVSRLESLLESAQLLHATLDLDTLLKHLLRTLMGSQLELPDPVWQRLNIAWIAFFTLMGLLNLYVAYSFATSTWVNFKLFGALGLMVLFMLGQGVYLSRHLKNEEQP